MEKKIVENFKRLIKMEVFFVYRIPSLKKIKMRINDVEFFASGTKMFSMVAITSLKIS